MALVDYFLKIDGIPGESQDAKHKDEIQVLSFSFGESQAGTMAFGGGGGAGKVQMQDFHFMMNVNKASPKLFLNCATGAHIGNAVLTARKAGKDQQDYLKAMARDKVGSMMEVGDMNRWLNDWINNYVLPNPEDAGEESKAKKPLRAAQIQVTEVKGKPGWYQAVAHLRPHFQLEGLEASMRLVAELPQPKGK